MVERNLHHLIIFLINLRVNLHGYLMESEFPKKNPNCLILFSLK